MITDTPALDGRYSNEVVKPPSGFKRTEAGLIPVDWGCDRLGGLTVRVGSGITPTGGSRVYKSEGRLFLRSQNIGWGRLLLDEVAFIDEATHTSFTASQIAEGDVLLNITGASIGRSAVADVRVAEGNVNQHVCEIRVDRSELDPTFLCHYLLSERGQAQIESFQAGGNRQGLNFNQIRSFWIPKPTVGEQRAIAAALEDAEGLVRALDTLISKKRLVKHGVMQQLITNEVRLPGFAGNWDTVTVGDIGDTYGGLSGKTAADFDTGDGRYVPFLNVLENVRVNMNALERVRVRPDEKQNLVRAGDLLFNNTSETPDELAMGSVAPRLVEGLYLNSFCFGFRLRRPHLHSAFFLAYLFRSSVGRELLRALAQGATRYNLSKGQFKRLELVVPKFGEQEAIAAVLTDLDTEIEALERRRRKAELLKQGMLQALMCGRVRLPSTEIMS